MRTVAIAQARMGSTRFPGKVMASLDGMPVLAWVVRALQNSPGIDQVVIATSLLPADDVIVKWCVNNYVDVSRGSESDVLDRFYQCAIKRKADVVLRLTCDCPFLDPNIIGQVIQLRAMTGADYCTNQPTWPDGLDTECFTIKALEAAWKEATRPSDRDCVTQYIIRNADRFPQEHLICPFPGGHKERWVLDTKKDYELCKEIASRCDIGHPPSCVEIMRILDNEPHLREINRGAIRNERFYESLAGESLPAKRFDRSNSLLARATRTIPFGSQTFSKSYVQFPAGVAPLYVTHGDGARVFDVDGNDYVDLVGALLPVVLGYRDPDVDRAVRRQLNMGMSFSLATKLETELAEKLCEIIPCAEMVKFGKSGTDVTSAAIRLARAYTGGDHVLVGGYHGWADWSMAVVDGKNTGIPDGIRKLSHRFKYGNRQDIEWLHSVLTKDIAAIIVEPMDDKEFLHWLREFCSKKGIILIFDEIKTGFRYSLGGAQKHFNVTPDLACFGKAMGNGMPISALVGKRDIMKMLKPENGIFYSGTFFGDTLSIAAALATIKKIEEEKVIDHLWATNDKIINELTNTPDLYPAVSLSGMLPLWSLKFRDHENPATGLDVTGQELQSLFIQEMAQQGVLIIAENGVTFAHKEPEVKRIIQAYSHTLGIISDGLKENKIKQLLKGRTAGASLRQ